jgi:hypothetical protein
MLDLYPNSAKGYKGFKLQRCRRGENCCFEETPAEYETDNERKHGNIDSGMDVDVDL